jgi:digalactosyldiacylglycerol synthase
LAAPLLAGVNSLVVQANCHRVVKLSGVLQEFAPMSECIENVHGIRYAYLIEGERRRQAMAATSAGSTKQRRAYFIGKLLWAKGGRRTPMVVRMTFLDKAWAALMTHYH